MEGLFGEAYKKLTDDEARGQFAMPMLRRLLPIWMSGAPLCDLEAAYLGKRTGLGKCEKARHFVSRLVPDLAFMAGLPGLLLAARRKAAKDESPLPIVLATLGGIVREGCDSPEALAMRMNYGRDVSRVATHVAFEKIKTAIAPGSANETFQETRTRVRNAGLAFSI